LGNTEYEKAGERVVRRAINDQVAPQAEGLSDGGLHCVVDEQVVEHNERQKKVNIAHLMPNSEEAGTWYYVVDCATCKAAIPFKHAPEGEPILALPTMMVRCFQCGTVHTYATDLISHRKAAHPCGIFRRDQPPETPNAQETSRVRQEDCSGGDTGGHEIAESKIDTETSSLQYDNDVIAAVSGKRATIFFLSSCFLAIAWILRFALNISYPIPLAVFSEAHSRGPAALLNSAYFSAILCGLALFIFGTVTFLVETCHFERNAPKNYVLTLVTENPFTRSLMRRINSSVKAASVTFLARQARRALSPMLSLAATFRSRIKRSLKLG
jgi:hypothetical protein